MSRFAVTKCKYFLYFLILLSLNNKPLFGDDKRCEYSTVVTTEGIIDYNHSYLSCDNKYLVLIHWLRKDKLNNTRVQEVLIYEIATNDIIRIDKNIELGQQNFYIEKGGVAWDSENNLYLAVNYDNGKDTIYVYKLKQNTYKKIDVGYVQPRLLSVSPDTRNILISGVEDKNRLDLYLYKREDKSLARIDNQVEYLRPEWVDCCRVVYEKKGNLFLRDIQTNILTQLTHFTSGLIIDLKVTDNDGLLFIRQTPDVKDLIKQIREWLHSNRQDKRLKPTYHKEYWQIDLSNLALKRISAFNTMKNGLFNHSKTIIIPLPNNSKYHLWIYDSTLRKQVTCGNHIDDLPLLVSKKGLFFRRDYRTLQFINTEQLNMLIMDPKNWTKE